MQLRTWILLSAIFAAAALLATLYSDWNWDWEDERQHSAAAAASDSILEREDSAVAAACRGKNVYIHDLPPDFNNHIIRRACLDNSQTSFGWMCSHLKNHGYGPPARTSPSTGRLSIEQFPPEAAALASDCKLIPSSAWYRTGQFALELLLHDRIRKYSCLTDDPEAAEIFYIPYYAGLDVSQYLFTKQVQLRDKLPQRLLGFLQASQYWNRKGGRDHVLVLGRIVWDFGRSEAEFDTWGSSLLSLDEIGNLTKLLIERDTWSTSQIAVPYPTGFHPSSVEELQEWMSVVRESQRDWMVSFAGSLRSGNSTTAVIRRLLRTQCEENEGNCAVIRCEKLNCEANAEIVNCISLRSVFCLMPPGDSPTRKGFFDSLVSGCIPVVFNEHTAYTQYLWHLPSNSSSYSVLFPQDEVVSGNINVIQKLAEISPEQVRSMQSAIAAIIPMIIYTDRSSIDGNPDAFDIILQNLIASRSLQNLLLSSSRITETQKDLNL